MLPELKKKTASCAQATANPDLMDDTYLLANRVITYSPRLLLDHSILTSNPPAQPGTV